jgi:hypothetical protein
MGVALFVAFEAEIPGIKSSDVDGKVLAQNIDNLDAAAGKLELRPLSHFLSTTQDEIDDLVDEDIPPPPFQQMTEKLAEKYGKDKVAAVMAELKRGFAKIERVRDALKALPPVGEEHLWFAPAEGLATVRRLTTYVGDNPNQFQRHTDLLADLMDLERCLAEGQRHNVRFHLSYDI